MSELEALPEEVLIQRIQDGDDAAFHALFDRYVETLRRYADRWMPAGLRRRLSAADVVQEAHLVAFERCVDFEHRGAGSFRNWLLRIVELKVKQAVRSHAGAALRSMGREVTRGARLDTRDFVGRQASPSQAAIGSEMEDLARQAMETLPEHYREVLQLTRNEQLNLREIGVRIGRSHEATKKLYARAMSRFANEFTRLQGDARG